MSGLKLFHTTTSGATEVAPRLAETEADVQGLVETHMETLLGVRFLASEYSTGPFHGGRIDSLGLDENGSPVVVEYKRGLDAGVINQGLFYLSWLVDHPGGVRAPGPRPARGHGRGPGAVEQSEADLYRRGLHPLRRARRARAPAQHRPGPLPNLRQGPAGP
ncbi:hypothetical protein EASAB2608_05882 [Streptomyces sp. EAS-AB2608]|nr:hypothetical protein EASAB2608_05882 [Streptomyces sp. EAS-AB2608]